MDPHLLAVARAAIGVMPDEEGLALNAAGAVAAAHGPLVEIGTYCGKSAIYLGAAARAAGTVLFTVDHHRGSEENQAGWEHHDAALVDVVIAVIGDSSLVAAYWPASFAFVFIDGGHGVEPARADYGWWAP